MKKCCLALLLIAAAAASGQTPPASRALPQPRIATLTLDSEAITVLHLRPGYVSSIRLPEEVSSVVLGDPDGFKAEHSPAEPLLVYVKPTTLKPDQTNLLINTKAGHQVSLHLVSDGRAEESGNVDFVLEFERPRSFLVSESTSSFLVAETRNIGAQEEAPAEKKGRIGPADQALLNQMRISTQDWQGKKLQAAIGQITQSGDLMTVGYSVLNTSDRSIDLLPPQIELAGPSKHRKGQSIKSELIPIQEYKTTLKHLAPGARSDGVVMFGRPNFKQSTEGLMLRVAQADEVDRPVLVSFAFTAPAGGETK
ncbi:MAG TPA: hypothetical protein VG759_17290 [Candidatus Angelobacter sp.]|jgi:hypothetical protein|nr:hypothetical protein [Candidatus Angelobacter sp.]